RLASGGSLFILPRNERSNRSWVTVAFSDIDGDGDPDFFPSFQDGPDAGKIIFFRNVTRERGGVLTFEREGPLTTASGKPIAGGSERGGWFPSIAFVRDWDGDGDGRLDAIVGSNHHAYLYRSLGSGAGGMPRFADAVALQADGADIVLTNPRFDAADIDADGDRDLFAGTQPGAVWWFENIGSRAKPAFAAGKVVAWGGRYLIADAHSGVKVADFDGDGLLDVASGRFWERADLSERDADPPRVYGGFFRNVGTRAKPRFEGTSEGGPFIEGFPICDAVRQNGVRAADWDRDGRMDLLAGDTDGFVWLFRNEGDAMFPVFATGVRVRAGGKPLAVTATGGHARLDVCDWDDDGERDLIVADGAGSVTLFRGTGGGGLAAGETLRAGGAPIRAGARASVLACDWDADGRLDLVLAGDRGYSFARNAGSRGDPRLDAPVPILLGGEPVTYIRPNLGSFVDWDGDGKMDFIGCEFENRIWLYRGLGRGEVLLEGSSPQMISGADAVDWNGDGDIDILTGQGHGGSGLRFYERDWLEDERRGTHPVVTVLGAERSAAGER
ncbi:MAG: VCBS repeat-containing protein, partial [Planctomycetes bacterium]|nr:VCBS repeat-containing protein [Planctomycetota bacterium]